MFAFAGVAYCGLLFAVFVLIFVDLACFCLDLYLDLFVWLFILVCFVLLFIMLLFC